MTRGVALRTFPAAVACLAAFGCGETTTGSTSLNVREASLSRAEAKTALLEPADVGGGFRVMPHSEAWWRYTWSDRVRPWKCVDAMGRLGQSPGVSGTAVAMMENDLRNEYVTNEIVSFDSVGDAESAFFALQEAMSSCTHDRAVELQDRAAAASRP